MLSFLVFITVLGILIIVHEWGHYISAKKLGIHVERFSVGFGPKLFSWTSQGTEFMVSAIPLGGFVKMSGDDRNALKGDPKEFYSHPVGHRAIVILMGPIINLIFAYFCFYIVFMIGFPVRAPRVGEVLKDFPAQVAGLQKGDMVKKIDAKNIESWDDLQEYISGSDGHPLVIQVNRQGKPVELTVKPKVKTVKNIFGQEETIKMIGVAPGNDIDHDILLLRYGAGESLGKAWVQIYKLVGLTFKGIYHVIIGSMPAKDAFAGPIRIFDVIAVAAKQGFNHLLYITGIISASLGIFNLFPVPVLDGGHLLFLIFEKARNKPISLKLEDTLTKIGLGLLLMLMVFVIYNDMSSIGWLAKLQNMIQHRP